MNFLVKGDWFTHSFFQSIRVTFYRLPKYLPELNPAELIFSKLKNCLKEKQHDDILVEMIHDYLETITTQNIISFYVYYGYL